MMVMRSKKRIKEATPATIRAFLVIPPVLRIILVYTQVPAPKENNNDIRNPLTLKTLIFLQFLLTFYYLVQMEYQRDFRRPESIQPHYLLA